MKKKTKKEEYKMMAEEGGSISIDVLRSYDITKEEIQTLELRHIFIISQLRKDENANILQAKAKITENIKKVADLFVENCNKSLDAYKVVFPNSQKEFQYVRVALSIYRAIPHIVEASTTTRLTDDLLNNPKQETERRGYSLYSRLLQDEADEASNEKKNLAPIEEKEHSPKGHGQDPHKLTKSQKRKKNKKKVEPKAEKAKILEEGQDDVEEKVELQAEKAKICEEGQDDVEEKVELHKK